MSNFCRSLLLYQFERLQVEERLAILNWVSPIPYKKHHDLVTEARIGGTCEWLLQDDKFREWEESRSSVILWLQGSRKCSELTA